MNPLTVAQLVELAAQVFLQAYALFTHQTTPVPVSAAPQITAALQAAAGVTDQHKTVIEASVNAAAAASALPKAA